MLTDTCARTERRRTIALLLTCMVLGLFAAPFRLGIVLGESMSPTFRTGQVFVTCRVDDPCALRDGDVVLLTVNGQLFLKRIYALGGETIWALQSPGSPGFDRVIAASDASSVQRLAGRYRGLGRLVQITVPEDHIYVLGDAECNSYDSRRFGAVPVASVRARVVISRLLQLWGPGQAAQHVAMAGERASRDNR